MAAIRKVMIVDDSEADHLTAEFLLEDYDEDIELISAFDGEEALNILANATSQPDVILLDINMPGMDGYTFLQEYAKRHLAASVVVMLTSSEQTVDREKCEAYSFVKLYVAKPLMHEDIQKIDSVVTAA